MKFKKYVGSWNIEKQKEIIGKILNIEEKGGKFESKVYTLETENEIVDVFGSAVLDIKLKPICQIGNIIKIVFLEIKKGKEAEYKDFDVYIGEKGGE